MRNPIDLDHTHAQAICQEIGERLRAYLREEPELPARIRRQVDQLCQLADEPPSIVPAGERGFERESNSGASQDRPRFTWARRRKS